MNKVNKMTLFYLTVWTLFSPTCIQVPPGLQASLPTDDPSKKPQEPQGLYVEKFGNAIGPTTFYVRG